MQKSSNFRIQDGKYSIDNVFQNLPFAEGEKECFRQYLSSYDFSYHTIRAMTFDIKKLIHYFVAVNHEPFDSSRVTVMDLTSFRRDLREKRQQAVSTVNRALVSIRRYLDWLVDQGRIKTNPAKIVKELRRQKPVPKGLDRPQVRKLMREIELRNDVRSKAIFSLLLHSGCRVSDLIQVELQDMIITERAGSIVFRNGKGKKERQVPLSLNVRQAIQGYLSIRPPVSSNRLFIGERGALTDIGVRALCRKYSAICGFKFYPHLCRHTFAKVYLDSTNNDLIGLCQILGHSDLNTCKIYCAKDTEQIAQQSEKVEY